MAAHGRLTVVKLDDVDLSTFSNTTTVNDTTDSHDTTTYGATRHAFQSGLGNGTITLGGFYDSAALGPSATIRPIKEAGLPVPFVYQPEGTLLGKEQYAVDVIVTAFNVSAPVADMVQWTAELQMTGDLDDSVQI